MGKASSAKKIKRVQQAGVSRAPGQRRQIVFPALIGGIVVIGLLLVFFARQSLITSDEVQPTTDDQWYAAFGINVCGEFQDRVDNVGEDTSGIRMNSDGLISIAPKSEEFAGPNATFGQFMASTGIQVTDTSFTLPDGTTHSNGEKCGEAEGRVALVVWPPQANDNTEPRIVTTGIAQIPFTEDDQIFELVFDSADADLKLPPNVSDLEDPSDELAPTAEPADGSTTTTAPGGTTVPADSTTTAPGDTTTTAPGG